jgi:hypothetical protein
MVQDLLVGEHFWPHVIKTVLHIPDAGDETPALQSGQVWQTQCTVFLQPKKQINISLNSDFDIHSFLGKGEPRDFHCMLCHFLSKNPTFIPSDDFV